MIVPEFIRFYGYSLDQTLIEYAKTFYSLVNSMYQIQAKEALMLVYASNANDDLVSGLKKQEKGISGTVQEVKNARNFK